MFFMGLLFAMSMGNPTIQPCAIEDGSEMLYDAPYSICKWNAGESGNNKGESLINIKTPTSDENPFAEDGFVVVTLYSNGQLWTP